MVDVDHFKQLNDRHGHDVGDQVLKMIASRLAGVSGGGQAFRYGGEEFAVLFPGKTAEECVSDLEALRQTVEEAHFILRSKIRARRRPEKILAENWDGTLGAWATIHGSAPAEDGRTHEVGSASCRESVL